MENLNLIILLILFGISLGGLIKGADWLIEYSSTLARRVQVSELTIGLTVVAMGTSLPEFAVSVSSALKGSGSLALGNVLGSNITNISLVFGLVTLVFTVVLDKVRIYDIFMSGSLVLFFALLAFFVVGYPIHPDSSFTPVSGCLLLIFFIVFLLRLLFSPPEEKNEANEADTAGLVRVILGVLLGLALVYGGGQLTVDTGVAIAQKLNLSEEVIGLSAVAIGTSLPELVAGMAAAKKGHAGMLVGNVMGSNIFNMSLVLGVSMATQPILPYQHLFRDIFWLLGITLLFSVILFWRRKREVPRILGGSFFVIYLLFLGDLFLRSGAHQ